jgi:hypothetical protein
MSDIQPTDYKAIMEANKKPFPEIYATAMLRYERLCSIPETIVKELEAKREFGLKKYKEISFQSNFDNAMSAPALLHLKEEIVDALNYTLHAVFQTNTQGYDGCEPNYINVLYDIVESLSLIYSKVCSIETDGHSHR